MAVFNFKTPDGRRLRIGVRDEAEAIRLATDYAAGGLGHRSGDVSESWSPKEPSDDGAIEITPPPRRSTNVVIVKPGDTIRSFTPSTVDEIIDGYYRGARALGMDADEMRRTAEGAVDVLRLPAAGDKLTIWDRIGPAGKASADGTLPPSPSGGGRPNRLREIPADLSVGDPQLRRWLGMGR